MYLHELFSKPHQESPGSHKYLKAAGSGSESATQIMSQLNNLMKKYNQKGLSEAEQKQLIISKH